MPEQITVSTKKSTPTVGVSVTDKVETQPRIRMMLGPSAGAMPYTGHVISVVVDLLESEFANVRDQVQKYIAGYRQVLSNPVSIAEDGQIRVSEHAMLPERPYTVKYGDDIYEFLRTSDGKIVISEILVAK